MFVCEKWSETYMEMTTVLLSLGDANDGEAESIADSAKS